MTGKRTASETEAPSDSFRSARGTEARWNPGNTPRRGQESRTVTLNIDSPSISLGRSKLQMSVAAVIGSQAHASTNSNNHLPIITTIIIIIIIIYNLFHTCYFSVIPFLDTMTRTYTQSPAHTNTHAHTHTHTVVTGSRDERVFQRFSTATVR